MYTKNLWIWQNATYSKTVTLRKMSGPRTVMSGYFLRKLLGTR